MNRKCFVCVFLLALLILQNIVPGAVLANEAESSKEQVRITALTKAMYRAEDDVFELEGNVRIEKNGLIILSDFAIIDLKEKIARLPGNVKLVQDETVITSELLEIFFNEDKAEFTGNVFLVNEENGLELRTDLLLLDTDTEDFQCKGRVSVIKGGDRIHADNGEYSKDRDEFWFSGNVHVETKDGESLDASEIIFYVSTNSFEALGGVELLFFVGE